MEKLGTYRTVGILELEKEKKEVEMEMNWFGDKVFKLKEKDGRLVSLMALADTDPTELNEKEMTGLFSKYLGKGK
jgi:hypothetical protein